MPPSLVEYVAEHGHNKYDRYFPFYDEALAAFREESIRLLEIGVSADSMKMWRACFPKAEILGLDISARGPTNQDDLLIVDGITFILGDQTDFVLLESLESFDVVIDDGGHHPDQQIFTFEKLFPAMNSGGWYFIEDLHTSYCKEYREGNTVDYAKVFLDDLHAKWAGMEPVWPVAEFRAINSLIGIRRS